MEIEKFSVLHAMFFFARFTSRMKITLKDYLYCEKVEVTSKEVTEWIYKYT